jgi:hypothetical protein
VVALGVGAVRFSGGGETLPSSVARRLRVGGILVYVETRLQEDKWSLRMWTPANSITLFALINCPKDTSGRRDCVASPTRD